MLSISKAKNFLHVYRVKNRERKTMATAIQKLLQKYDAQQSSGSNKSNGAGNSSNSNRSNGLKDEDNKSAASLFTDNEEDEKKLSAKEALSNLVANSKSENAIFEENVGCYYERMVNAVNCLVNNDKWNISMDMNGDGSFEDVALADAIAGSFDSELDLYIQEKVNEAIDKYGSCSKGYLGQEAQKWLKEQYNIVVEAVGSEDGKNTNRTYAFSLVDENGNVIEDANGKKGSYIFSDCLIPDGYAQGAEVNLSSILDQMGYDCISKADFLGNEQEYVDLIQTVGERLANGDYAAGQGGTEVIYGNRKDVTQAIKDLWGGSGAAPGMSSGDVADAIAEAEKLSEEEKEELKKQIEEYDAQVAQIEAKADDYKQAAIASAIAKKEQEYYDEHKERKTFQYEDLSVAEQQSIETDVKAKIQTEFSDFDFTKLQ